MNFDPKTNKFPYPEFTDEHYLKIKKNDHRVFDVNYEFIDKSKGFLFKQKLVRFLLYIIVFPVIGLRMGLKIKNRKIIKKNKKLLKQGAISIGNHVHMDDYISVMTALRPFKTYILAWPNNLRSESKKLVRAVGGIPIPDSDVRATYKFFNETEQMINEGGWLHVCPEGSMWEYYGQIRPFKKGFAKFAIDTGKPIVPLAFSYRRPNWIRRKIFKQIAVFTLTVGDLIYPDNFLPMEERIEELTKRCHEAVCRLSGTDPKDNLYPPIFNKTKRIDYYTDTYGVGYKGSH